MDVPDTVSELSLQRITTADCAHGLPIDKALCLLAYDLAGGIGSSFMVSGLSNVILDECRLHTREQRQVTGDPWLALFFFVG